MTGNWYYFFCLISNYEIQLKIKNEKNINKILFMQIASLYQLQMTCVLGLVWRRGRKNLVIDITKWKNGKTFFHIYLA
jgi:hypothetical protein